MGPAVPPIESIRAMVGKDHLWPIDDVWNYHAGGGEFKTINVFSDALSPIVTESPIAWKTSLPNRNCKLTKACARCMKPTAAININRQA